MIRSALVLCAAGCAVHRVPAWDPPALPPGAGPADLIERLIADGDRAFAARDDPRRLDEAIQLWRAALDERPQSPALLCRLSRAYRWRGDDGVSWAERALGAANAVLRARALGGRPQNDVFAVARPEDLPALVAYAEALLAWSLRAGQATLVTEAGRIFAAANRAGELDRTAGWGASDRILGTLAALLPFGQSGPSGDLRYAEERFEAALASAPGYLPTRVAYAEFLAVRLRDGRLYRSLLEEVLAADADALPEAAPENRAAQRDARRLLHDEAPP
jgi:hypothetical protein